AYVEGRQGRALRLMGDVDPLALPASLGGHVALVKAALYQNDDPKKSMGLLDTARLLMPGTLIEESALRRGMAAAGKQGDIDRFESLAGQYIHRYTMSVYRRDFDDKFSRYLIKLSYLDKPERRAKLERLLADMQPDRRRTLYLNVARSSLVGGQTGYAVYAAGHAEALSADRPKTLNQARTYKAAAALVTGELMPAVAMLNALDVSMLPQRDREIAQAALRLAGEITRQPVLGDEMAAAPSQDGKGGEPGMDAAADDVVAKAEKLIADVDQILAESEQ
ncbi:MAG: chemotaxis protein MotC, partial [Aestuariivirgaceae bacterium]